MRGQAFSAESFHPYYRGTIEYDCFLTLPPSGEGARRADEGCGLLVAAIPVEAFQVKFRALVVLAALRPASGASRHLPPTGEG
jgi:hypothetical protein